MDSRSEWLGSVINGLNWLIDATRCQEFVSALSHVKSSQRQHAVWADAGTHYEWAAVKLSKLLSLSRWFVWNYETRGNEIDRQRFRELQQARA